MSKSVSTHNIRLPKSLLTWVTERIDAVPPTSGFLAGIWGQICAELKDCGLEPGSAAFDNAIRTAEAPEGPDQSKSLDNADARQRRALKAARTFCVIQVLHVAGRHEEALREMLGGAENLGLVAEWSHIKSQTPYGRARQRLMPALARYGMEQHEKRTRTRNAVSAGRRLGVLDKAEDEYDRALAGGSTHKQALQAAKEAYSTITADSLAQRIRRRNR